MKKQLLKVVYAFITTAMMLSASANAQIVYTDINPDTSIIRTRLPQRGHVSTEHNMDVNNDGILDLKFILTSSIITGFFPGQPTSITGSVSATPLNGSAILSGSSGYPAKMNLNDSINANVNWSALTSQVMISKTTSSTTTTIGNWNTTTDGFLGLRVIAGSQTHYCWIRLSVEAYTSGANAAILVSKDFAYNSIPNQPILAGETGSVTTGISENSFASSINLFPNPTKNHLTIDLGSNNKKIEVTIADITGKVIYTTVTTDTNMVEVNTNDFSEGIYVVQIQAADFIGTKKLVLER